MEIEKRMKTHAAGCHITVEQIGHSMSLGSYINNQSMYNIFIDVLTKRP